MGTKATRKDFYMEIRKSLGRFLSILFIVALGVVFSPEFALPNHPCALRETIILTKKN